MDAQGNVYVADSGNERIQKLSAGAGRARDAAVGQLARVPTGGQRLTDGL